ncbi:MAG: DUF1343 domain-containing protein [Chloroflexota bacterium]|nr:DUF1343 domain-containing protein [Chloroflexota bacterium]
MLTGLDVFLQDGVPEIAGRRVGLISNQTGVDRAFRGTIDLLHAGDRLELVALFGPEHGVRGDAQAGNSVRESIDQRTGLPTYSLYGDNRSPTSGMLNGLDALVFDIQDAGVRFYTYLSTMIHAQEAAASAGLVFVVLDRPNPITGNRIEGNLPDPDFQSFVGRHPIPIRHGMTFGELARMSAAECGWPEPVVGAMRGWQREMWFDETGLPWVAPSPNLPTLDSATLYPGTCLVEGTNLSEGRGTTRPFELIGAPWVDPFALAADLERRNLPGVAFRPTYFTPMFSKHANTSCGGVQIHIVDRDGTQPVVMGMYLLESLRKLHPDEFEWRQNVPGKYFIDLLLGSDQPRLRLDAGETVAKVVVDWEDDARAFDERRQPYLLYG